MTECDTDTDTDNEVSFRPTFNKLMEHIIAFHREAYQNNEWIKFVIHKNRAFANMVDTLNDKQRRVILPKLFDHYATHDMIPATKPAVDLSRVTNIGDYIHRSHPVVVLKEYPDQVDQYLVISQNHSAYPVVTTLSVGYRGRQAKHWAFRLQREHDDDEWRYDSSIENIATWRPPSTSTGRQYIAVEYYFRLEPRYPDAYVLK